MPWFIIDYFGHNIDLIEQAKKLFRPQSTDNEIVLAEQSESDYEWDPEWSYKLYINIPTDISIRQLAPSLI